MIRTKIEKSLELLDVGRGWERRFTVTMAAVWNVDL